MGLPEPHLGVGPRWAGPAYRGAHPRADPVVLQERLGQAVGAVQRLRLATDRGALPATPVPASWGSSDAQPTLCLSV